MTTTPRIRTDLTATPAEEAGVQYFDVKDPRTGGAMRLYHFEWLVAQRMDGHRSFADVATWARSEFGWTASPDDLSAYAERLRELGFFDGDPTLVDSMVVIDDGGNGMDFSEPSKEIVLEDDDPMLVSPSVAAAGSHSRGNNVSASSSSSSSVVIDEPPPPPPRARVPTPVRVETPTPLPQPRVEPATPPRMAEPPRMVEPPRRAEQPRRAEPPVAPAGKTSGLTWVLLLLFLAAAGYFVYVYVIAPAITPTQVTAQPAPAATTVFRFYDGKGTVQRSEPVAVSFGEAGNVVEIVAGGTDVTPGKVLATLDTFSGLEKQLKEVRDREAYYAGLLKNAQAKNKESDIKSAEEKVAEKHKLVVELEAKTAKGRLVSTATGTVAEVLVKSGDAVKAGDAALKIVDKRVMVDVNVAPGDSAAMKLGQSVQVRAVAGGAMAAAKIVDVKSAQVRVEILEANKLKVGEAVQLVKAQVANVIRIPVAALLPTQGGASQVFVVTDGVAKARTITVAEKDTKDALVSAGLAAGDKVLVNFPVELADGQKVSLAGEP